MAITNPIFKKTDTLSDYACTISELEDGFYKEHFSGAIVQVKNNKAIVPMGFEGFLVEKPTFLKLYKHEPIPVLFRLTGYKTWPGEDLYIIFENEFAVKEYPMQWESEFSWKKRAAGPAR